MAAATLEKVKKLMLSDRQMKDFFQKAKNIGVTSAQAASKTVKAGTQETIKTGSFLLRNLFKILSLSLIFIAFFTFGTGFLGDIYSFIQNTLNNFFINYIGPLGVTLITFFLFGFLILITITVIIPKNENSHALQKEFLVFSWILAILIIFGLFSTTSFVQNYSGSEQLTIVQDNIVKKQLSFTEKFACFFGSDINSCLSQNLNKKEAEVAQTSKFYISLQRNLIEGFQFAKTDLQNPLELNFKFTATSDLKVNKIECYIGSRTEKNRFFSSSLDETIKTSVSSEVSRTFKCENIFDAVSKIQKTQNQEHTIVTVLYMSLGSSLSQTIPIVDYNLAKEKLGLNPDNDYSKINLIDRLKKAGEISVEDYKLTDSSGFFKIQSYDNSIFPLIFGDGKKDQFSIPIIFSSQDYSNLGKFKSGSISIKNLPSSIGFQDGFNLDGTKILLTDNKFKFTLRLIEEDNENSNSIQFLKKESLDLDMKINFEKEDRFKLKVIDWDVSKEFQTNINN